MRSYLSQVRRRTPGVGAAIVVALFGLCTPSASAGNFYWAGDNVNNPTSWSAVAGLGASNWSSSPNFNSSTGTTLPGAADNVFFYFAPNNLNTVLGQDFSIASLNFMSNATSSVTIGGGNTLTIGAGGLNVAQGSAAHTLTTAVNLDRKSTRLNSS